MEAIQVSQQVLEEIRKIAKSFILCRTYGYEWEQIHRSQTYHWQCPYGAIFEAWKSLSTTIKDCKPFIELNPPGFAEEVAMVKKMFLWARSWSEKIIDVRSEEALWNLLDEWPQLNSFGQFGANHFSARRQERAEWELPETEQDCEKMEAQSENPPEPPPPDNNQTAQSPEPDVVEANSATQQEQGISLFDVAMYFTDSDDLAAKIKVKEMANSKKFNMQAIGNCPKDGRASLYRLSEVLESSGKYYQLQSNEKAKLRQCLTAKLRLPTPKKVVGTGRK